jgi:hypothetical protein
MEGVSQLVLFAGSALGFGFPPVVPFPEELGQVGKSDRLAELAVNTIPVVEVERGFSQIPGSDSRFARMIAFDGMVADGQSGLSLDDTHTPELLDPRVGAPVADKLDGRAILLARFDGMNNKAFRSHDD